MEIGKKNCKCVRMLCFQKQCNNKWALEFKSGRTSIESERPAVDSQRVQQLPISQNKFRTQSWKTGD